MVCVDRGGRKTSMGCGRSKGEGCKTSMEYGRSGREEGARLVWDVVGMGRGGIA